MFTRSTILRKYLSGCFDEEIFWQPIHDLSVMLVTIWYDVLGAYEYQGCTQREATEWSCPKEGKHGGTGQDST